jgi:phosphoglycerate dehydrogenase-like enzyme
LRAHLHRQYPEEFTDVFSQLLHPPISFTMGGPRLLPPECEVLVCGVPTRDLIESGPQLKALVIPWAGLPRATEALMADYPNIKVFNLHHNATATAELALALLLAAARELIPVDRTLRRGDWRPRYVEPTARQMEHRRAVVLGTGAIGHRVARMCLTLNMHVIAVNRSGRSPAHESLQALALSGFGELELVSHSHLDSALQGADALLVCLPLTPATVGMIGPAQLALLADQAIVVNVSRGPVIDETALYEQLQSRRLRAGLDVWYHYPADTEQQAHTQPSSLPFANLDNVIMTPHLAAHTTSTEQYRARELAALLNALAGHGDPPPPVDLDRGY